MYLFLISELVIVSVIMSVMDRYWFLLNFMVSVLSINARTHFIYHLCKVLFFGVVAPYFGRECSLCRNQIIVNASLHV